MRYPDDTPEWVLWYTPKGYKTRLCLRCKGHLKHRSWCRWSKGNELPAVSTT